jgi:hypothetical protein
MWQKALSVFKDLFYFIGLALRALHFWRKDEPVTSPEDLARFAETRSKYVSQITLYQYVKTRAGTRYTLLFGDETFSKSLNIAKWEIYLVCLGDLCVYLTARIGQATSLSQEEQTALALYLFDTVLEDEEVPDFRPHGFDEATEEFHTGVGRINWDEVPIDDVAFLRSMDALYKWAPIADELKKYDGLAVKNSIRFRWRHVRDQLNKIWEPETIAQQWRDRRAVASAN